jgi:hypothetical protein
MIREHGPENRINRCEVSGFKGRICPCCINTDKKGRTLSFGIKPWAKQEWYDKPIHAIRGRKGKSLRDHRVNGQKIRGTAIES